MTLEGVMGEAATRVRRRVALQQLQPSRARTRPRKSSFWLLPGVMSLPQRWWRRVSVVVSVVVAEWV